MFTLLSVFYGKVLKEQVKKGQPGDIYDNETVRKYTMQVLHKIKVNIYLFKRKRSDNKYKSSVQYDKN